MFGSIHKRQEEMKADLYRAKCEAEAKNQAQATAGAPGDHYFFQRLREQDRRIEDLQNQFQTLLLATGFEVVDVPAHREIRKLKK